MVRNESFKYTKLALTWEVIQRKLISKIIKHKAQADSGKVTQTSLVRDDQILILSIFLNRKNEPSLREKKRIMYLCSLIWQLNSIHRINTNTGTIKQELKQRMVANVTQINHRF